MCARIGNQLSCGVVTARIQTDVVRSLHHQCQDLHQSTYPVPLGRSGLILLSGTMAGAASSGFGEHQGDSAVLEEVAAGPEVAGGGMSVVRSSRRRTRPGVARQ
jgi:hypothetical protein